MIDGETQLSIVQMEIERQLRELKGAIEHPKIKKVPELIEKAEEWYNEFSELNAMLCDWNDAKKRKWTKMRRAKIIVKITNKMRILKKKQDKDIQKRINEIIGSDD